MIIQYQDLWNYLKLVDALCITTNMFVKLDGSSVMGRGCALEAKNSFTCTGNRCRRT